MYSINNEEFNIPFYLFEEIINYINCGKKVNEWHKLYTLIKMAELNNHFTKSQAERIIEMLQ